MDESSNTPPPARSETGHRVTLSPGHLVEADDRVPHDPRPSPFRAWCYLVWLSLQRLARAQQMVWIALILLGFTATVVALVNAGDRWSMAHWRHPRGAPRVMQSTYQEYSDTLETTRLALPWSPQAAALQDSIALATQTMLEQSGFFVFSNWIVFSVFLSFLLPIWSLSFATEAVGGERESRSLIWLLTRPLPRSSIYLAKYVALLPWCLGLNLGGFAVLCLAAGRAGRMAWPLYWPAVLFASLAFCSLFHLLGACVRRPAVIAIVYTFFLETIVGNMPGNMKRISISFYTRCMMLERVEELGSQPQKATVFQPVDGSTAMMVLAVVSVLLLIAGTIIFARTEYQDLA